MSQDEQMLVMGRTLQEFAEARKKLAALFSEADRHATTLQRLLWYLKPQHEYGGTGLREGAKAPDLSNYPAAEVLFALIDETLATIARKKQLQAQLKEFGVEAKD